MGPCSVRGKAIHALEPDSTQGRMADSNSAQAQDSYESSSPQGYVLGTYISPQQAMQGSLPRIELPPVPLPGIATHYLSALAAQDEYYTPEDDIASAPSSFRRLRRSRSMFTSDENDPRRRQDPSIPSLNERVAQGSRLGSAVNTKTDLNADLNERPPLRDIPQLRAPKSMSFLRNRNLRSGSVTTQDGNARDYALPQETGPSGHIFKGAFQGSPRLVSKSSFFSSRSRRAEPVLRKSLRSTESADDADKPHQPIPVSSGKEERFKVKARKVSKSLKTKLKNLFSLSKSEEETPSFPQQHISAQRTHVNGGFLSPLSSHEGQESKSEIGWTSIHRVPSGVPSLQTVPPTLVHSNRVSLESLRSATERKVSNDKSLTSWANSGPSTLTSQQQQEWREWERQRLSIIKENGAHAPSSSTRRRALGTHVFQTRNGVFGNPNSTSLDPIVDSQRVYSALMKRMEGYNHQTNAALDQQGSSGVMPLRSVNAVPSIESLRQVSMASMRTIGEEKCMPASHHHSRSPDENATPTRASRNGSLRFTRQGIDAGQFRTGSPVPLTMRSRGMELAKQEENFSRNPTVDPSPGANLSDPFMEDNECPSRPNENGHRTDGLDSLSSEDRASLSTPASHLFRTKPPYREALRKSMEAEQKATDYHSFVPLAHDVSEETPTRGDDANNDIRKEDSDLESTNNSKYSESVYSTDDYHPIRRQSSQVILQNHANMANNSNEPVDLPLAYRSAGYHNGSSNSSIDWKTWLSANVAKFESSPTPPKLSEVEYALPTMPKSFPSGHIRESAQTHDDDDEEIDVFEPPTHKPTLPTSPLATVEPNVVKISPLQRSIKRSTPPSMGRTLLENDSPLGTPPVPAKSALRTLKCAGPNVGYSLPSSVASSPGLTAAVQRQFGAVSKFHDAKNSYMHHHGSSDVENGEKYGSCGGRTSGMPRIAEQFQHGGQQDGGNREESRAFI